MTRAILFAIGWIVMTAGSADAAPARLLYQPHLREQAPAPIHALHDSIWEGVCFNTPCTIKLNGDGTLQYFSSKRKDKSSGSPGTWRVTGNFLFFEINKFSEHRGTIAGNVIQGDSSNKSGTRGKFQLYRMPVP